jgi:hypothetical protein
MSRIGRRVFVLSRLGASSRLSTKLSRSPKLGGVASFQRRNYALAHNMSPLIETHPPETFGNFDLVKRADLNLANIVASKWRSRVSGLSVVHLDYEGTSYSSECNLSSFELVCFTSTSRQRLLRSSYGK